MNDPGGTISRIDDVVDGYVSEDWTTSPDAMRWQAEQPEHGSSFNETLDALREAAARQNAVTLTVVAEVAQAFDRSLRPAIVRLGRAVAALARSQHPALAPMIYGDAYRRHRRRCRLCNPRGNPLPLKTNGRAYTRRLRARRRRARRR